YLQFSVPPQRRLRRGRHRRTDTGGHPGRRPAAQSDDPGQQERLPLCAGSHQLQADSSEPPGQSQLGVSYRSRNRSARPDRGLQALSRWRRGRNLSFAWHERGADRFQSEYRIDLREHLESAEDSEARGSETGRPRREHDRHHRAAPRRETWRRVWTPRGGQSADGEEEVGGPTHRFPQLLWHAGDGRRIGLHRQVDRRAPGARRGNRQDALAIQDRLEHQFNGDHLHAQGQTVRDRRVRSGGGARQSLCGGQGSNRRLDVDVCVDGIRAAISYQRFNPKPSSLAGDNGISGAPRGGSRGRRDGFQRRDRQDRRAQLTSTAVSASFAFNPVSAISARSAYMEAANKSESNRDPSEVIANSPMSAPQIVVVAITIALNA